jgi:hypothetical protein
MLRIHPEKVSGRIQVPAREWSLILSRLRKNEEVRILGKKKNQDAAVKNLIGLGKEIWKGIDPVKYQRKERAGW